MMKRGRGAAGRALGVLTLLLVAICPGAAQDSGIEAPVPDTAVTGAASAAEAPSGFRGIELGMELQAVKDRLMEDPFFDYRGDPDVSLLPQTHETLIECRGFSYLTRAYFQFSGKKLYIMILLLDEARIDHYSLFTTLTEKYGGFTSLSPSKVVWETEETIFSLERPLSVKYVDRFVFEELKEEGQAAENLRDISRSRFLEEF